MDVIADPALIQLTTKRLVLRPPVPADALAIQQYHIVNRHHLQPWQPLRSVSFFGLKAVEQRIEYVEQERLAGRALHLLVLTRPVDGHEGELVGECNFSNIVLGVFQACHLGYSLAAHAEGKGLMREALTAGIAYVFEALGLHRVMASHVPENLRSERVLAAMGFEREGLARAYLHINGEWADHVLNSLINPVHR
ncbi:GNAT family N-acetyltransferase [Pseudomonas huanghezhanensis]|uniref:GNAT family N-acetyltransferase n=1 Tax=Pseudomonas huanghezhanensis TaxID=3002903 RepID=UPI0022855B8A|nr:GNAT family N-acetyltransferase [Pseudomonas sp. BSw22131]